MTCKDCGLWDIEAAKKDKAGRFKRNWPAKCLWVSTEKWPISIKYPFQVATAGYVNANDGHYCPCFQKREKG